MICNIARTAAGGSEMVSFTFTGNGTATMTFPQLVGKKNVIVQDLGGNGYRTLWTAVILEDGFKLADYYGTSYNHNIYLQKPGSTNSDIASLTFNPETGVMVTSNTNANYFYNNHTYAAYGW